MSCVELLLGALSGLGLQKHEEKLFKRLSLE